MAIMMKIEIEIEEKYEEVVKAIADAWFKGDVNAYAKDTVLSSLAAHLDAVSADGNIADNIYIRLMEIVDPKLAKTYKELRAR